MGTSIGTQVEWQRELAGLSLCDLETITGIPRDTLVSIENGTHETRAAELVSIAWATGSTYGDLIGDSEVRARLHFNGSGSTTDASTRMKSEAVFFFELDDYLDQYAIVR
jgi:DNA-binding XRE family transcriptional regulator